MTNKINGIDVSEYFIDVVDEGGSTIDYKILPNSERLLVEKIFEQNQQLKHLQEENKELKDRNTNLRLNLATYDLPEIKKVLTDWRTGELDKKFKNLQKENEGLKKKNKELLVLANKGGALLVAESTKNKKYEQALEEIKEMILGFGNTPIEFKTLNIPLKEEDLKTNEGKFFDFYTKLKDKINEVLNDRN